ncbi:MAG: dihydrofolate reductase [Clostridium sp.]
MAVSERRGNHCPEECGMISIVVAMDANQLIGANHKMPWHCPADLAHFRQLTLHHHLLMGREPMSICQSLDQRILHCRHTAGPHILLYGASFCRSGKQKRKRCMYAGVP